MERGRERGRGIEKGRGDIRERERERAGRLSAKMHEDDSA